MKEENRHFAGLSKELKCITGLDGLVVYVNAIVEKTLGYSSNELLAQSILKLIYLEDQAKTHKAITQLVEKKIYWNWRTAVFAKMVLRCI